MSDTKRVVEMNSKSKVDAFESIDEAELASAAGGNLNTIVRSIVERTGQATKEAGSRLNDFFRR